MRRLMITIFLLLLTVIDRCPRSEARKKRKRKIKNGKETPGKQKTSSWRDVEKLTDVGITMLRSSDHNEKIGGALKLIQASKYLTTVDPVGFHIEAVSDFDFRHFVLSLSYLQAAKGSTSEADFNVTDLLDDYTWNRPFWEIAGAKILTIKSGDMFEVVRTGFGSWWEVRVVKSKEYPANHIGLIPLNYVVFNKPTSVDPIADLIWADEHGLLQGIHSDSLSRTLIDMLFAGRAHLLTSYESFVGNVPGLETFWLDLASKVSDSGPTYIQSYMTRHASRSSLFEFRKLVEYLKEVDATEEGLEEDTAGEIAIDNEGSIQDFEINSLLETILKNDPLLLGIRDPSDEDDSSTTEYENAGNILTKKGQKRSLGVLLDLIVRGISGERLLRALSDHDGSSPNEIANLADILAKRNDAAAGEHPDDEMCTDDLEEPTSDIIRGDSNRNGGGNFPILRDAALWMLMLVKGLFLATINVVLMGISILVSASQVLTIVAHRDVMDSSSPAAVFRLLCGFVMIMSLISSIPFQGLQTAISPVRELLYFNSLLSLLSWHALPEYNMDTGYGRAHLFVQMSLATIAVLTSARDTWLKWDFVVWVGCAIGTVNFARSKNWEDGSLSSWLYELPAAYVSLTFSPESYIASCSACSAFVHIMYMTYNFVCELLGDAQEDAERVANLREGGSSRSERKRRGSEATLSLRDQIRASIVHGATMHGRFGESSNSLNGTSRTVVDKAALRRRQQQQASLERRAAKKREERLRLEKIRSRKDESSDQSSKALRDRGVRLAKRLNSLTHSGDNISELTLATVIDDAESTFDSLLSSKSHVNARTRLSQALKRARQKRHQLAAKRCVAELSASVKDANIARLDKAIKDAESIGEVKSKEFVMASKLVESLRKRHAAVKTLRNAWEAISRDRITESSVPHAKTLKSLRSKLERVKQIGAEAECKDLTNDVERLLDEGRLQRRIEAAYLGKNAAKLETILSECRKRGLDAQSASAEEKLGVLKLRVEISDGLRRAIGEGDCDSITRWLNLAAKGDIDRKSLPDWMLEDLRKRARKTCDRIRLESARKKRADEARKSAEIARTKEASKLIVRAEEIEEGFTTSAYDGDEAALAHWIAVATTLLSSMTTFVRNADGVPTSASTMSDIKRRRDVLAERKTSAEEELARVRTTRALRDDRRRTVGAIPREKNIDTATSVSADRSDAGADAPSWDNWTSMGARSLFSGGMGSLSAFRSGLSGFGSTSVSATTTTEGAAPSSNMSMETTGLSTVHERTGERYSMFDSLRSTGSSTTSFGGSPVNSQQLHVGSELRNSNVPAAIGSPSQRTLFPYSMSSTSSTPIMTTRTMMSSPPGISSKRPTAIDDRTLLSSLDAASEEKSISDIIADTSIPELEKQKRIRAMQRRQREYHGAFK